jgi:hypothetical protein
VSFLASRLTPSGQFWAALAGGIALARAGSVHGLRAGYGASCAALVETVALIGPARMSGPLTQALNAPLVGRLLHRGFGVALAACLAVRLAHYAVMLALVIFVVVGGIEAYVDSYDQVAGFLGFLPEGATAAFVLALAGNVAVGAGYSVVQVLAYRRALRRWPAGAAEPPPRAAQRPPRATWAARAVALVTVAAWAVLLAWPTWGVLAAAGAAIAIALAALRPERRRGLGLAFGLGALLGLGALGPALLGVVELDDAARRALRALLLVLSAAWARGALGAEGVRALAAACLWALRAVPGAREAAALTPELRGDRRLGAAGRDLAERLRPVPKRPVPVADALSDWVASEAALG